jgi:hypothetical protein
MRTITPVLSAILLAVTLAGAQVVIAPQVQTDTIDLFSSSSQIPHSTRLPAMVGSLLLPGLGHQFLGQDSRALIYFSTEALFVFGLVFSESYSHKLFGEARSYASLYANMQANNANDDQFWKIAGDVMDTDEYNRILELNRTPEDKYTADQLQWRWIDEYYMKQYRHFRERATRMHVVSSFFLGAMILDRIVAFVDIRRATRQKTITSQSNVTIQPTFEFRPGSAGAGIAGTF